MNFKPVKYGIEYLFFNFMLFSVRLIPEFMLLKIGNCLGVFLYIVRLRRSVVQSNLQIAFGDKISRKEHKQLCIKTYKNFACILFEFLLMNFISPQKLSNYIEIEGLDTLEKAVQEGKGVILAGSHFGHWELLSAGICTFGFPFYVYAGRQKNLLVDKAVNNIRRRFGMVTISKSKTATFQMMKVLKNKKILGMAGDLNVPRDLLFVDFFGKKAAIGQGLASFALKREAPLLFLWSVRRKALKHQGYITRLDYHLSGNSDHDIANIAQLISAELEQKITEYPDHYFWFNRRWKTRPAAEKQENIY